MKIDALIKMANQISDFFEGESGHEQAPAAVAAHLQRYWEPRMRKDIIAHYDLNAGEGLDEVALKAVALLAAEKRAATPTSNAN
jgi:formate dehydrogenase subunit delta